MTIIIIIIIIIVYLIFQKTGFHQKAQGMLARLQKKCITSTTKNRKYKTKMANQKQLTLITKVMIKCLTKCRSTRDKTEWGILFQRNIVLTKKKIDSN